MILAMDSDGRKLIFLSTWYQLFAEPPSRQLGKYFRKVNRNLHSEDTEDNVQASQL